MPASSSKSTTCGSSVASSHKSSGTNTRLVSPDSTDGYEGGFWGDCLGTLHESLPNICLGGAVGHSSSPDKMADRSTTSSSGKKKRGFPKTNKAVNIVEDDGGSPDIGAVGLKGLAHSLSCSSATLVEPDHADTTTTRQQQQKKSKDKSSARERSGGAISPLSVGQFIQLKKKRSLRRPRSCSPPNNKSSTMMGGWFAKESQLIEDNDNNNAREDTRDPSPSHYKYPTNRKSIIERRDNNNNGRDAIAASDTPLLLDPPSTNNRSRSVPLDKLLKTRKDRGVEEGSVQASIRSDISKRVRSLNSVGRSRSFGEGAGAGGGLGNIAEEVNVEPYALKHDEVVTALIDDALQGGSNDIENGSSDYPSSIDGKSSVSASPSRNQSLHASPTRRRSQQQGGGLMGSPTRKKISTPQWMRNKSRKLDERSCSISSIGGTSRASNVNTSDFFHINCVLHKEKGSSRKNDSSLLSNPPSAVGREASLEKLKEKLSLLSEIESGKYGKGADMLRSDAVAFAVARGYMISGVDAVETRSILTLRMGFVSMNYGIVLQWDCASGLVKQIVLVKMCRDDFLERSDVEYSNSFSSLADVSEGDMEEDNSIVVSDDSQVEGSPSRVALKTALNSSDDVNEQLQVSILNVKQLVAQCDHPRHNSDNGAGGFAWWLRGGGGDEQAPSPAQTAKSNNHNIQPYIRFVFGRHQHVTRAAKFNKGNITWNKRQRNSCVLPSPPEGHRWFDRQDDLIVEVRSRRNTSDDSATGGARFAPKSLFKDASTTSQKRRVSDDPLLAAVTVPLSSIVFGEEGIEGGKTSALSRLASCLKQRPSKAKDEVSSTNITLPLPMKCCSSAPYGSITLRITRFGEASPLPSRASTTKAAISSPVRTKTPKTQVDATQQGPEGIELLPLTDLISSWVNDGAESTKSKNKAKMSKIRKGMTWSKRYDPRTKKWSNVNSSSKIRGRRGSFKKSKEKEEDKFILFQVVDRVMGKEEQVQPEKKRFLRSLRRKTKR
jgi:hypothetical protein